MSEQLHPCPFCGGPPSVFVQNDDGRGGALLLDNLADEAVLPGIGVVFCHECGARVESDGDVVFDARSYRALADAAVRKWQDRDSRHGDLYRSSFVRGLSKYPRDDEGST